MAEEIAIRWSRKAIRQIKEIGEYIEIDSPWQAERIVQKIYSVPEKLKWSPAKGTIVPEFGDPDLREVSLYSWRIIYRLKGRNLIEIAAVIHGKRLLKADLLGS